MCVRYAHVHDDGTLRHLGDDGGHTMLRQPLGECDLGVMRILGLDEIDAEAREIARRGVTFDLE